MLRNLDRILPYPVVLTAFVVAVFNGVLVAKLKVPAFIATLGSSFIVRGVALLMAENTTVSGLPRGIRIAK